MISILLSIALRVIGCNPVNLHDWNKSPMKIWIYVFLINWPLWHLNVMCKRRAHSHNGDASETLGQPNWSQSAFSELPSSVLLTEYSERWRFGRMSRPNESFCSSSLFCFCLFLLHLKSVFVLMPFNLVKLDALFRFVFILVIKIINTEMC